MKRLVLLSLLVIASAASPAQATRVFACEPEWASLLRELGGDQLTIDVATTAQQDVHQIEARPSLIAQVRRADLLVCSGADLEIGWLPQLLKQAGNTRLAGSEGAFYAAEQVSTLERPTQLSRAAGDVHPQGNPHVHLDPYRVLVIAKALAAKLQQVDPDNAASYAQRLQDFQSRWTQAITRWEAKAAPLKGRKLVVHHRSWVYLLQWLGIEEVGALEPKPGVPPSSGVLASLLQTVETNKPFAVIRAAYQDGKASEWLAERSGIKAVALPFTVGGDEASVDLFGLFDSTIDQLLQAAR